MRFPLLLSAVLSTAIVLVALAANKQLSDLSPANNSTEENYCGSNLAWQSLLDKDPTLLPQQEALEDEYYAAQQTASTLKTTAPPYTIPVVFHIVHEGGVENVPESAIQTTLDFLNESFANTGPYDPATGVPTDIDFCLAKRKPDGSISTGIERINDPLTNMDMNQDLDLKNLSRYDPTQYLNVWIVNEICAGFGCGVAGYAYFPSAHGGNLDGIVVEARWLGNSPGNSAVLTHEVGHYLGLYHTFEGGCQNDDCLANGDRVCDTPPDQSTAAVPCNASPNSCSTDTDSGLPTDQPDQFQNYMDYGDWDCYSIFTAGQRDRMHFFLEGTRGSLLTSQGCLDPCTSPLSVSITNDFSESVDQGATVNLTASGSNADNYTWYLDGVEIGTGNPFPYVFATEGSYTVSVQASNSDPNCLADAEATVLVRCPVLASFEATSFAVTPGTVVFFTNASIDATTYEWLVDGNSEATTNGFFYQFDNLGTYTVRLEASDGNCSDDYAVVITVGTEGSSQTGIPIWPMQGGTDGGFHTVDWRTTPPLLSNLGTISDQAGGATGAAFNGCGAVVFYAVHTAQSATNQLYIFGPDGSPLLDATTPNAPGLNAVKGGELQVIPVPSTSNEWYLIYRQYANGTGAPANNEAYLALQLRYSRVKMEADGQLTVMVRDQLLNANGISYTYSDGLAVSRTVNGDADRHYLYAGRRAFNQSSISLDRFVITSTGISWQDNTGNMPASYWSLTHAGSFVELSPTEDRVVVGNRNQFNNFVDFLIVNTATFNAASAVSLVGDDLTLVADGQAQDESNVLPVNQVISSLGNNGAYPLRFLRNFKRKLSGVEFSPNGRFLYLTSGGYVSSGNTNLTYLAQVDLESSPLEVRVQIQDTPSPYSTTTGVGCPFNSCGDDWNGIGQVESSYNGNLYFVKRNLSTLFVIPNPNNFMPQNLVPGVVDLATADEPNINLLGLPGAVIDQIDGYNYLSGQTQTVDVVAFGLDCAGECRAPFELQITSDDNTFQEIFTVSACPTVIPLCVDTNLVYRITDLELGIEYPNAIVNGEINAPLGSERFEFSEPQGCPEDCDEPYVFFYGEDADYSGRTLLAHEEFLFIGGQRNNEALLTKLTTAGEVVWTQTMRPINNLPNVIIDLKIDSEGMIIGAGSARSGTNIGSFAFKMNPDNGAAVWTRTYTDAASDYFNVTDIHESPTNGDYIMLGTSFNASNGLGCDAAFYSIDRNDGDITGQRINYHLGSCEGIEASVIKDDNFYVTGRYNFAGGGFNRMRPAITQMNSTGTLLFSRLYLVDVNQDARLYSADITTDGANNFAILAFGDDNGISADNNDVWLIRTNFIGAAQLVRKYTLPEPVNGKELMTVGNGYVLLAQARNSNRLFLLRINGAGNLIWAKQLDDLTTSGAGDEMILAADGYVYLTAEHTANANRQLALLRIDLETGEFPSECITNQEVEVVMTPILNPYDGFNSLSPYNTQVDGSDGFDLTPDLLDPLPISCAPSCEEICDNGTDDDGDGLIDCDDPDLADDCCCYVPPVLELGDDTVVCENGVIVLDAGPDFESYLWSDLTTEQTLTTTFPGEYSVTVTDQCGTTQSDTILITVDPATEIDLGPDVTLCPGETLTLSVDGFVTYEWFPATGFDCNTCPTVVFTASGDTEIIVVATSAAGCISTDTLPVTLGDTQSGSFTSTGLCPGDVLTFGTQIISEPGIYLDTLNTGGCLTVDTLQVTPLETFTTSEDRSICAGQSTVIFGNEETAAGTYSMTFTAQNGCDSTHTVNLMVEDAIVTNEDRSICAGQSTVIFGNEETEAGTYTMAFTTPAGCDSTHTVNLMLIDEVNTSEDRSICAGETTDIFGTPTGTAGEYSMTFMGQNGCDSTHTINLDVLETFATSEDRSICADATTPIFGNEESEAGTYSMTFVAQNGCDSTHTIVLSLLETFATSETVSICAGDAIDIFGQPETEAGDYSMTFMAQNGCDSTHTVTLSLLDNQSTEEDRTVCTGETTDIFGTPTGTAGEYSMTFAGENGCDSTHTITLAVLDTFATNASLSLCAGDATTIFGQVVTEAGDYSMTFTAQNGCDSTHTVSVSVLPTFSTSATASICPGDSTEVFGQNVGTPGEYSMTFTAVNGCDSVHTITVLPLQDFSTNETIADLCQGDSLFIFGDTITQSGVYAETFTAVNGCDSVHTVTAEFLPTSTTMEEVFICEGESITIFGELVSEPGIYQESYTGSNGCDSTSVITLTEETFSGSAYIFSPCPSDPEAWIVYISTHGNGGPYHIVWNGQVAVSNTLNAVPEGDHIAQVTSANGCMYEVEFTVRPFGQPWWGLVSDPTCNDPQGGQIRIEVNPISDDTLTYSLDGINFSDTPLFDGLNPGDYTLYVKYGDRCVITENLNVPEPAEFSLTLPEDRTIKWGESLPIVPTTDVMPGATYEWIPATGLDCSTCDKVIANPEETTRYTLKITDANGCTQVDDILVKVDRRIPYYVPNAFSPNGDSFNEYFTIYSANDGVQEVLRMSLFDRWGGEVFTRTSFPPNREELGWDGRYRDQLAAPGVYVYYLELKLGTGEIVMVKGDVVLIR